MKNLWTKSKNYLYMFLFPILTFYLLEFYTHNPFTTMKIRIQFLNMAFFLIVMLLFLFIFKKLKVALMVETGLFMVIGLANYFVMQFRSAPIMPWDIFSIGTAISVADNYQYTLNKSAFFTLIGFLILLIFESRVKFEIKSNWKVRIFQVAFSIFLLCSYVTLLHQENTIRVFKIYDKLFTPSVMTKRDGTMVAFLIELQYMSVDKPSGYNRNEAMEILNEYQTDQTATETPNIIVIMNEALSDPKILGDFETNEDYMPFLHDMLDGYENTISGNLNVSILGGNTPNTEFEYLTGNSLAFLPQGSIPFQQYINGTTPSMASHLKGLGYQTIAMHPYYSTGWDRDTVYPNIGFDESYFLEAFQDAKYIRKYVSDESSFDKIIDLYEKKEEGQPLFLFNVTMQNHSSYTDEYDNFNPTISTTNMNSKALNNYLSLLKLSDDAFKNLVAYFDQQEEDTIIVMFGDHQTTNSVMEPIWNQNGKSGNTLTEEEEYLRYKVPFVIWANYDIAEESNVESSPNYLGPRTLEVANLPMPNYFEFISEQEEHYPVISALFAQDASGTKKDIKDSKADLNTYAKLQYYQLFGRD